jgi:uncharacterized damage-inducible protein DinB
MKPLVGLSILFLFLVSEVPAQNSNETETEPYPNTDLSYSRIPEAPASYSAGNVAARIIDGLGFRYYWATEDLRKTDLDYKPSENARTTSETIQHIYGLSNVILNAMEQNANLEDNSGKPMTFTDIRKKTLDNLKRASDILKRASDEDIEKYIIIFGQGDSSSEFPFWNLLNGPIADAIYHTGQVVSFRRSSGNPINPKVRVFTGNVSE